MSVTPMPEGRSASARSAARAHLLSLRAARLQRRGRATSVEDAGPAADLPPKEGLTRDVEAEIPASDTLMQDGAPELSDSIDDSAPDTEPDGEDLAAYGISDPFGDEAALDSSPEDAAEAAAAPAPDPAEGAEATAEDLAPQEDTPEPVHDPVEAAEVAPPPPDATPVDPETSDETPAEPEPVAAEPSDLPPEDSPLFQLPGAGPGLVWMLHKAQITSLDDLATAKPEDLRTALGVVGDIIDLPYWIDWAQTNSAPAKRKTAPKTSKPRKARKK